MSRRSSRLVAFAATAALVAIPTAAFAHAEITPSEAEPGVEVQFTVNSIVERPEATGINSRIDLIVPRQFAFVSCDLPATWTCTVDTETYAPDTLLVWEPSILALPADVNFAFTAVTPEETGTYLIRTLQEHFDGFVEPWVYDTEPYPAPKVTVGGDDTLINGEGSEFDPPCFGPDEQPLGYDAHDGSSMTEGCEIPPREDAEAADAGVAPVDESRATPVGRAAVGASAPVATSQELPATGGPGGLFAFAALSMVGLGGQLRRSLTRV